MSEPTVRDDTPAALTPDPPVDVAGGPAGTPAGPPPVVLRPGIEQAATLEALLAKGRRTKTIKVPRPDGSAVLVVEAEAISNVDYDALASQCPPTEKERLVGQQWNLEKFGPRLLAACLTQPAMTVDEATALWKHPDWSGGEVVGLFREVNDLCQRGLDVPFIAPG